MYKQKLIEIKDAVPRLDSIKFKKSINWGINDGEHWAIIGPNGAGKTLLIDILTARYALKSGTISTENNQRLSSIIKTVAFRDIYNLADIKNSYYQQRWNAGDEHDVISVSDLFCNGDIGWIDLLVDAFKIQDLIHKPINLLSSGELRKVLILKALISKPRILVLDNPFIGLDDKSRAILNDVLERLASLDSLQIVLVLSDPKDLPNMISHVLPVKEKDLLPVMTRKEFMEQTLFQESLFGINKQSKDVDVKVVSPIIYPFENALIFKNISIKYGSRTILTRLDWIVKRGEKWALLGENGSGKSTLLSLVAGDNPQAYANDISLFDRKRGTGESIWDIKKHIGYVSPEMHLYYLKNVSCIDVVGSGFFDTIGLYQKCNDEQRAEALRWMQILGVGSIKDSSFLNVSTGEQRLILLARVFVKNPDLLILDEPLHGLDIANKQKVKRIIEEFCNEEKALIYVTHYKDEIPDVVDKRLLLKKII